MQSAIRLRYRLLPYIYSGFHKVAQLEYISSACVVYIHPAALPADAVHLLGLPQGRACTLIIYIYVCVLYIMCVYVWCVCVCGGARIHVYMCVGARMCMRMRGGLHPPVYVHVHVQCMCMCMCMRMRGGLHPPGRRRGRHIHMRMPPHGTCTHTPPSTCTCTRMRPPGRRRGLHDAARPRVRLPGQRARAHRL